MKGSLTRHLILKDWQLHKRSIALYMLGGAIALAIVCVGGQTPFLMGSVFFFTTLIIFACILPNAVILNERKKQTLAFVMSLPVSSVQYGAAKLTSTVGIFLAPWLALLAAGFWMVKVKHALPGGVIPMGLILAILPLIGFCLIVAAALVGETEGWYTAAVMVINSSYWFVWYSLIARFPELGRNWLNVTAVWSPNVLMILAAELTLVGLILAVTLFIQSRKRDFI
jgi:ABC-2 type transport system permease protein